MSNELDDPYVCKVPCATCPFRKVGSSQIPILSRTARRIYEDLQDTEKMFPCHETTHTGKLATGETRGRGEWRFCAGAYLAMTEAQRQRNRPLRTAIALGLQTIPPRGEKLVFSSLDEFLNFHYES